MSLGILGKKIGMTQIFDQKGEAIPVTLVKAGPCVVIQKKLEDKHGYNALQLGFDEVKKSKLNKPLQGIFEKLKLPPKRFIKEIRCPEIKQYEVGQEITVDIFQVGDFVDISGVSKGKGFAGVVKRWGFHGGPASHGAHGWHRRPGSIGASAFPSRVFKGKKMAGHLGMAKVTVQNLEVVGVEREQNLLLVKGAVPGGKGGYLVIRKAIKKSKRGL